MCGAISIMLPTDRHNPYKKAVQLFVYHFGKITSYASIGLLFSVVGKGFFLAGYQQQLSIIVGVLMIVFVMVPERILMRYNFSKPVYKAIATIKSGLGKQFKKKTFLSLFTIGLLNGYLPCGMVYVALFGAIAMSTQIESVLYMILFGLGTVPFLTFVAYVDQIIPTSARNFIQKFIPIIGVCIGMLFILRGLGVGIPYLSPSLNNLLITDTPACVVP